MSAPIHAPVVDQQGRLTISLVDDQTVAASSTGSTTPLSFVSRLSTQDADMSTKVTQKVEVGTNGIVGGVAALSEFKGKLVREDVNCALIGLLTGKKQNPTVGQTTNWTYFDLSNAKFDYVRLIADSKGEVYSAWIALDCVLDSAQYDGKNTGEASEQYSCMGPQLIEVNAIPISKHYVCTGTGGDTGATNLVPIGSTFGTGAGTTEAPIPISYLPAAGQPASAPYASGRMWFASVKRVLTAAAVIGGQNYSAGNWVRYRENMTYLGAGAAMGTAGAQTAVTLQPYVSSAADAVGPEITVGSTVTVELGGANQEDCVVTAVTATTISFTTTKTHATTNVTICLKPASGYCAFDPQTQKMHFGDSLITGDAIRVLFASYQSKSTPVTIGTTSPDTTSLPGVPGRVTPVTISAFQVPRVQSYSIKVSIARKQVQGCGENEIVYGTAGVPKIDYSLDVLRMDNSLISLFSSGSTNMASVGDVFPMDYIVRYQLANPQPFVVQIKNPNSNGTVIKSYTGSQPVFSTFSESGTAENELTQKFSGQDYSGDITISATS